MIKLKNICAGYGKKHVLFDISAAFQKGTVTSIIGPNGCGKSTLLKISSGILPVQSGSVFIDGTDHSSIPPKTAAKKIAYLSQSKNLPDMTVGQMVLHGRFAHLAYPRIYRQIDREAARTAMEQMGISNLSEQKLSALSGGIRQNAFIAMALAQSTDYILMDEPTTYLDIANRFQLMETIAKLAENGKGIVAVLHDLPLAMEFSKEIIVMKDGRIAMTGTPEEIFSSDIIKSVFGVKLNRSRTGYGFSYYYDREEER